jgi:ribosomal protein S18 acetylase RimI-like enzyme
MISLHPVQEHELPLIADLANRAFGTSCWDIAVVQRHCRRHGVRLEDSRIACFKGKPAGFALVSYPSPAEARVTRLGVVPEARRQGIARELVKAASGAARGRGCAWLWLRVREEDEAAVACSRALGFEPKRREPIWRITMPEGAPLSFLEDVVFRPIEEPLEMYEWYDALPLPFNQATFEEYRHSPGRPRALRATRHGETIAAAYVTLASDERCVLGKLRLAEMADWVPEFLRAAALPGRPLAVIDANDRYGQWFASWGYAPGPARVWLRRSTR